MEQEEEMSFTEVWRLGMVATSWQLVGAGIASVLAYVNLPARILLPSV